MKSSSPREAVAFPCSTSDLVVRARTGDPSAWPAIVRQFDGLLHSIAGGFRLNAADTADAVQLTWLRLFENLHKIRQDDRIAGWLSSTMRRECIRIYHRRTGEWLTGDPAELTLAEVDGADVDVLRAERNQILEEAVDRLSPRQRDLVRFFFYGPNSPSYDEAGRALSLAIGSVGPTRMRALLRLRELLRQSGITTQTWREKSGA